MLQAFVYAMALHGCDISKDSTHKFFLLDPPTLATFSNWRSLHSGYRQVDDMLYTWITITGVDAAERICDSIIHLSEQELDAYSQWLGKVMTG